MTQIVNPATGGVSSFFSSSAPLIIILISILLALTITILLYIFVLPEKRRKKLNGFFRGIADIFNFKGLLIESILKFFYVLLTFYYIFSGLFSMFTRDYFGNFNIGRGLLTMLLSPIIIRLIFELFMMLILLVKNVIQINTKLGKMNEQKKDEPQGSITENPVTPIENTTVYTPDTTPDTTVPFTTSFATPAPEHTETAKKEVFCPYCGVKYDRNENAACPSCGKNIPE